MTNAEAVNWLINITADIGKVEHSDLWHYEQALSEIREMLEDAQPETHDKRTETHARDCVSGVAAIIAAIEAVDEWDGGYNMQRANMIRDAIKALPSEQPQSCKDVVSKADVLETYAELYDVFDDNKEIKNELHKIYDKINALQAAQPQRMKGRWIYGEHDIAMCDGYWCDKCGFFVPWDYKYTFIDFINDYHFCPNCGSDMRGEDDETD